MFEQFTLWLLSPFRSTGIDPKVIFLNSIGFGLFISFFIVVFQPFGLHDLEFQYKNLSLAGYGPITAFAIIFNYYLLPKFFKPIYQENNWKVYQELLYTVWTLVLIAILNWGYTKLIVPINRDIPSLLEFVYFTVLIGLIPMVITAFIMERRSFRKQMGSSIGDFIKSLEKNKETDNADSLTISFSSVPKLSVNLNDLLCIKSTGNYCFVYFIKDDIVKKEMVRLTLKKVMEEMESQSTKLIRCHKSYIVNLEKVKNVSGNSRGYRLHIPKLDFEIPVSRNFSFEDLKIENLE